MIVLLLLACGHDEPAAEAVAPDAGVWEVEFARRYDGDCRLADMQTGRLVAERWEIEDAPHGFRVTMPDGFLYFCGLDGDAFLCQLGTVSVLYYATDGDGTEVVTRTITGAVTDARSFAGVYAIEAACDGAAACPEIGQMYGEDFTYPCTAEAAITGAWTE
ncbi:MAG TPA: hypothetical protein PKA64_16070 [Myxococcota bacterium]|nr:hypothetical protein [Myxococcota bacterium]